MNEVGLNSKKTLYLVSEKLPPAGVPVLAYLRYDEVPRVLEMKWERNSPHSEDFTYWDDPGCKGLDSDYEVLKWAFLPE